MCAEESANAAASVCATLSEVFAPAVKAACFGACTTLAETMKTAAATATPAKPGIFARLFGRRAAATLFSTVHQ